MTTALGLVLSTMLLNTGAAAADGLEEPKYVRVCDTYGQGFFYIPGSETCLKIGGHVRFDIKLGDDPYTGESRPGGWMTETEAKIRFDARSETEFGTLRSFMETKLSDGGGTSETGLSAAYIEVGGFLVGLADSQFTSWTGYAADVIIDDAVGYGYFETNQVNYTYKASNGLSFMLGLEQGAWDWVADDAPHVVTGIKYEQTWGGVSAVAGYDTVIDEFAIKPRLDVNPSPTVSLFAMAGWKSDGDKAGFFGAWNGDYAVWLGAGYQATEKTKLNLELSHEQKGKSAVVANVTYEIVPDLTFRTELDYVHFTSDYDVENHEPVQGIFRLLRTF